MAATGDKLPPVPHEHEWQLRAVDFEDASSVQTFECVRCQHLTFKGC